VTPLTLSSPTKATPFWIILWRCWASSEPADEDIPGAGCCAVDDRLESVPEPAAAAYCGASWNPAVIAALYVQTSRICVSTFLPNSSSASISASGSSEPGVWKNRSTTPAPISNPSLGHADVLEPHGHRLALRDGVPSHAGVIRANFPCPRCRCFDADRGILPLVSLSRAFLFAALPCYVALAPCFATASEYRSYSVKHEFHVTCARDPLRALEATIPLPRCSSA
jgi:hypothetical protein